MSGDSKTNVLATAVLATVVAIWTATDAMAADKTRNGVVGDLDTDAAWGAGGAGAQPGASDRAVWNSGSTNATTENLANPVTWGGIMVNGLTPAPGATIGGLATLSLGSLGISLNDGVTTNRRLTLSTPVQLLADQDWVLGDVSAQAGIQANGAISGAGKLTVKPNPDILLLKLGVATFANGGSTFSGGFVLDSGAIVTIASTVATSYTASGGNLTSGVFGTGPLTINGGTLNTSNKIVYNQSINIAGDFTFGSTSRSDVGGAIDLGGATRTVTLTRGIGASTGSVSTGGGNFAVRFQPQTNGLTTNTISNGSLRFVAASSVISAGSFCGVVFGGTNGNSFVDNAGLIIGQNVFVGFATSFPWSSATAQPPAFTIETGGLLTLSENTAPRSPQIFSLSGTGTVLNLSRTAGVATLNLNGRSKTSTSDFAGIIRDTDSVAFAGAATLNTVNVSKNGKTTQILSGANTYTGLTQIVDGVLSVGSIANGGATSGIGASTSAAANLVLSGGVLRYTGAGSTSDRLFTINATGGTIESSGAGALDLNNAGSVVSADPAARNSTYGVGVTTLSIGAEDLVVGMTVTGTGFDPGTTITAIDRHIGTIALSLPTNASAPGVSTPVGFSTANRTLNLAGTNTGSNNISGALADSAGSGILSVAKAGDGKWVLSGTNAYTGTTIVNGGTLVLKPAASSPVVSGANGAVVNSGNLVIEYSGTSPKATIVDAPATGLAANANTGFVAGRVRTTNLVDPSKAIGWLDDGVSVFQLKYTYKGDADLTGDVTSMDFAALVGGYGSASGKWSTGDFNYDGLVNTLDFNYLAGNFGKPAIAGSVPAAALGAVVPEPATFSLIGAFALMSRRRTRRI